MIVFLNGEFVEDHQATVSVFDHGLLYGDGIFEGIRAYDGQVLELDRHLDRLINSAKYINLHMPWSKQDLRDFVLETLRRNELHSAYIRLVITRGRGDLSLDPTRCTTPTIFIIATEVNLYPAELYQTGIKAVTVATRRVAGDALDARAKTLNYLNNILSKMEATAQQAHEAVLLNNEGYISECSADNIFIVKGQQLVTPPAHMGALEGVTRNIVMDIAAEIGLQCQESPIRPYDVYAADECFLTGTGAELIPVVELDHRPIGAGVPGKTFQQLLKGFHKYIKAHAVLID
ncbi:branched-chain amino acid aminotransferase [Sulfobacillus acidophilus TPY]|uniref:Branched-chain-amino-acid aminotransferase n=1 Tax=Sulfobacillus acidophilus (strain ATCC 700253 / DSM 10332 / NAL) TaxID=679936 RepID=G8TYN7_SULAD|nr:branched-chain amino acid aminotransferase [Sulfobacillus acidophilus TPY]AEW04002.1 branched chain amino acid aminotransferase apoenzyme [Sulfobacillus acidophilus DSM 10332]